MKSFSLSNKNNIMTCIVVIIAVGLILWLTLKPSDNKQCPKNKNKNKNEIIVPIGNGQSVALTKEEYHKLMQEGYQKLMQEGYARERYRGREGFYVNGQDYTPSVQTENEYSPMLSLYKPKEQSRIIPEPTPGPAMPIPIPGISNGDMMTGSMMTGATGPVEGYGNVFLDNFDAPSVDPALDKYRQELTGISPFFLNNGRIMNGEAI
jgi:hypothetical protein